MQILPPCAVHGVGDDAVLVHFPGPAELARERLEPAHQVGRDAAGDDQADAALGALAEIRRQLGEVAGVVLQPGVHRAHQHAVAQGGEAQVERREEVRVGRAGHVGTRIGRTSPARCPESRGCDKRMAAAHGSRPALIKEPAITRRLLAHSIAFTPTDRMDRPPMSLHDSRSARRPDPDQAMVDIANYVTDYYIGSSEAYTTARYMLLDSLACSMLAMSHPECVKHLGPLVPGADLPGRRARAGHLVRTRPGAGRLQHRRAGALARLQRHLAGGRVGPPVRQPRRDPGRGRLPQPQGRARSAARR